MSSITETAKPDIPYWRLSGFYFFYFALLGALLTYWGVYLKEIGFSIAEIGTIMASLMATKIIAPNLWGWVADRTQQRMKVVRMGALLTIILFAGVLTKPGFIGMMVVIVGFSFFWNAILPQQEVVTLNHLQGNQKLYSRIRLWGSIGFIVTSSGLGLLFDRVGIDCLPYILLAIMVGIWLSSQFLSEQPVEYHGDHSNSFLKQLMRPAVLVFFLLCFLLQITHGPYYAFFLIYLEGYGYSKFDVGLLISLGVFAEIVIFLVMHRLMDRFSIKQLAISCFALAAIRWWITAIFPDNIVLIVFAQLTHAATFGIFHAISIHLVHHYFSPQCAGQGQALYSALSFGAGGAVGAYLSGQVWTVWGGQDTFLGAAMVGLVAVILALWKMEAKAP
ncbi:MAG: MFS transporter [Pseudomonadales bacterium]|nr:MFS transporter [Pseudomonadales bacterium]